jgi:hypothetical protein
MNQKAASDGTAISGEAVDRPRKQYWDPFFERVADIPWGVLLVVVLVVLLVIGKVKGNDIETIRALATSAGLLGIGHGLHSGAKHFAKPGRDS